MPIDKNSSPDPLPEVNQEGNLIWELSPGTPLYHPLNSDNINWPGETLAVQRGDQCSDARPYGALVHGMLLCLQTARKSERAPGPRESTTHAAIPKLVSSFSLQRRNMLSLTLTQLRS